MSRYTMTIADSVRAYRSSTPAFTIIEYQKIADKFKVAKAYVKRLCDTPFDCTALDKKWSKRMRKDLLKGEAIGSCVFLEFKGKDLVDVILDSGKGKVFRADAHILLATSWRDYYDCGGFDYE